MKGVLFFCALALLLGACESPSIAPSITPTLNVTPTPNIDAAAAVTPGSTLENAPIRTLTIWWPERLAPIDDTASDAVINAQLEAFSTSEQNLQIEFRRKRSQDIGGIMSTLRSAREVAPGALPDITLMRREDLLAAVEAGLLQPLEGRVSTTVVGDLYSMALQLGRVDNQLYGLPYTLDVLVVAHNGEPDQEWSFDAFLDRNQTLAFSGSRSVGVSEVFLIQYLAAGGTLPDNGEMTINTVALEETLRFYESALVSGLIDSRVLGYSTSADYESLILNRSFDAGVVQTSRLSMLATTDQRFSVGTIPTSSGEPFTVLNGWMWVIVASNPDQQVLASRFINWMMDTDRQGEYSQTIKLLPSQRTTLRLFPFEGLPAVLTSDLLSNAILPLSVDSASAVTRVMHNALIAVLNGDLTAEEATREAVNQLSG